MAVLWPFALLGIFLLGIYAVGKHIEKSVTCPECGELMENNRWFPGQLDCPECGYTKV